MDVHRPDFAPAHVHGCPVHVGGTPAASVNADGVKQSDACLWDEHDDAFKARHKPLYDSAVKK